MCSHASLTASTWRLILVQHTDTHLRTDFGGGGGGNDRLSSRPWSALPPSVSQRLDGNLMHVHYRASNHIYRVINDEAGEDEKNEMNKKK